MVTTSRVLPVYEPSHLKELSRAVARAWRSLAHLRLSRAWVADELHTREVLHTDAGALGGAVEALASVAFPLSLSEATAVREEEAASFFNRLAHEVVRASFAVELAVARGEHRLEPAWLVSAAPVTPRPPPWGDELTPALVSQGLPPEVFPQVAPPPAQVDAGLRECVALLGAAGRHEHLERLTQDFSEERLRALLVYELDGAIVRLGHLLQEEGGGSRWAEANGLFRRLRVYLLAEAAPFQGEFPRLARRCVRLAGATLSLFQWARYTSPLPP